MTLLPDQYQSLSSSLLSSLGRARVSVKEWAVALKKTADIQLNVEYQIKLFQAVEKLSKGRRVS